MNAEQYKPIITDSQEVPTKKLWYDGANQAADAVVVNTANRRILLVLRKDTREWALPGGFVDKDEQAMDAARREVAEETSITLKGDARRIYAGKVEDPRNSNTAWIETSAFVFPTLSLEQPTASDDAQEAAWKDIHDLPPLYGSHRMLADIAFELLKL